MSQYSETIGSFTRTGNYPLEANYIFESEEALKQFYTDPIQATTLHEGLLKIVKSSDKQSLYWVVDNEGSLEFTELIYNLDLGNQKIALFYNPIDFGFFKSFSSIGLDEQSTLKNVLDEYFGGKKNKTPSR